MHQWARYKLFVNNAEENVGHEEFRRLEGDWLSIPNESTQQPYSIFLQAHRYLHGFG